ncbi:hypothetical protein [Blastococcus brunescens]|uniref:Oxidoreductase FAD/NAD(P)-binding domain-containing protein n=1 Tax=Blastococcus brunescens TaxID=1564165 RepID=A0ABZ1B999_9ACTN|nr:hypothetical protein [Blastococcus sp. BMG 8361]WRL66696.1 hypothetical protein U6N30_15680 [Blastococcus sp. BMG 8361]
MLDLRGFLGEPRPGVRIYCCGPAPLLAAIEAVCADWPPHALRTERFVAEERAAPVRDAPSRWSSPAPAARSPSPPT